MTEFCEKGSLGALLSEEKLNWTMTLRILLDISHGMCFLHSKKIIHRDLKCDNVLVDKNYIAKIADFNIAKLKDTNNSVQTRYVGSSYYIAPEVVLGKAYDEKCDVFSFSMIMVSVSTIIFF